jgi:hypothetical protein
MKTLRTAPGYQPVVAAAEGDADPGIVTAAAARPGTVMDAAGVGTKVE